MQAQVLTQPTEEKKAIDIIRTLDEEQARLDSLDQERLPKHVTGGVMLDGNFSSFIITEHGGKPMNSNMRAGLAVGGFLDFYVVRHFSIMGQALITMDQNRFAIGTENNRLWSFGIDVPVYFMGRFGGSEHGYINFGAGPYTHFTFASNIGHNNGSEKEPTPIDIERKKLEEKYSELYKLHSNHFGLAVIVGYEFNFGLQINFKYNVSLSDIATFLHDHRETWQEDYNASLYPQRLSLGVAYRFAKKNKK